MEIIPIDKLSCYVKSGNKKYLVWFSNDEWTCDCEDYLYRKKKCKHIGFAVSKHFSEA